ncbi:Uncharacterised protein [Chlamydia trachomatis]|nr:Uncharacterised protein [Chlamydia trachomatis]
MEETFHRLLFLRKELNVVDQQQVEFTVSTVEFFNGRVIGVVDTNCIDEFVGEFLG